MSNLQDKIFGLEASLGKIAGYSTVNKFGEALNCDNGVATDIWDGADGSTGSAIWVPPTAARTHQITSTSTNDTSAGTGMRTVRIYGLTDWDSKEVSEDVILNGTSNVATSNSYVIIHRMVGLTWGSGGVNDGVITATADTDSTVTAAIIQGGNQTEMVIYGIPSVQKLRVVKFQCSIVKSTGSSQRGDGEILFMPDPGTNASNNNAWINKENFQLVEANPPWEHDYGNTPKKLDGPGIVKIQVTSNSNDTIATASFDAFLVDN